MSISLKKLTAIIAIPIVLFVCAIGFLLLKRPPLPEQLEPLVLDDVGGYSTAVDLGLATGFQDIFEGHHKRGRALLAADFDLDGRLDFYIGNPGDKSFVVRNVATEDGHYRFDYVQTLLNGDLAWGGVTGDFDNDGDYDIFVTNGANEGIGYDYMFRNDYIETGKLHFTDITQQAGVAGPVPAGKDNPIRTASGNARLADYDQDGDVDIFVSTNYLGPFGKIMRTLRHLGGDYTFAEIFTDELPGRNTLFRNNGDFTFTDVTHEAGLDSFKTVTRHSTWLDYDNDSDMDIFENNMGGENRLWKNQLAETGNASFIDATEQVRTATDTVAQPLFTFASATADINNDGWQDLVLFYHHKPGGDEKESGPYKPGHAIFINNRGQSFTNIATSTGINVGIPLHAGVMGCQIGDISGDGAPDILFGNGDPFKGTETQLYLSDLSTGQLHYTNASHIIDFPAPQQSGIHYPPFPYRTHGTTFVDVDNDGDLEIAMLNGGPALNPDTVREPNRLFDLDITDSDYFKVKLEGDGEHVSRDAIGARLALTLTDADGEKKTLYRTLQGGSCFSAHNSFTLHFYIGEDVTIDSLKITWPDGSKQLLKNGLKPNSTLAVHYDGLS